MRTSTIRRLAAPALVALIVLPGLAGCSDDGGDDDTADSTTTEASDDATTTSTEADDGSTTTGADGESTTTEEDGSTDSTTADVPDVPDGAQEGVEADEEEPNVNWTRNATPYRGDDGKRVAYLCPPDGELNGVWGTDVYTDDSSVCSAAVHAGLINQVEGGRVVIEIAEGEDSYEGSEANEVTSQDYGDPWEGSFTFPED